VAHECLPFRYTILLHHYEKHSNNEDHFQLGGALVIFTVNKSHWLSTISNLFSIDDTSFAQLTISERLLFDAEQLEIRKKMKMRIIFFILFFDKSYCGQIKI
jgi:hypothetical protein